MPQFQEDLLANTIIPFADKIKNTEFESYSGDRVAGLSGLERQAMGGYGALTLPSEIQQASDIFGDMANRTPAQRAADIGEYTNQFTSNVVDPTVNRMLRERAQARVGEDANMIARGAFGGARRDLYEGERQGSFEANMGQTIGNLQSQGYLGAVQRANAEDMSRMNAAKSMLGAGISGLGAQTDILGRQLTAGGIERGIEQADLDAQYNEFLRGYADPLRKFGVLTGAAGAIPTGYGTTTERDPMGQAGNLLTAGGSFLTGAAPLMQASDPRLKENVVEVGVDPATNLNLYEFNYIGDDSRRFRGVMADEVERNYPEAVAENDYGFKGVNYDLLNIEFKEVNKWLL